MMIKVFIGDDSVHNIEIKALEHENGVGNKWYYVSVDGELQGVYPSKTSAAMGIADYIFDFEVSFY